MDCSPEYNRTCRILQGTKFPLAKLQKYRQLERQIPQLTRKNYWSHLKSNCYISNLTSTMLMGEKKERENFSSLKTSINVAVLKKNESTNSKATLQ